MVKAIIKRADEVDKLWLLISQNLTDKKASELALGLGVVGERFEDTTEKPVAYAFLESEVEAVRDACNEWLAENKHA